MVKYFLYIIILTAFFTPTIGVYCYIRNLKRKALWKQYFSVFFLNWEKKYSSGKIISPALKEIFYILYKKDKKLIASFCKGHFSQAQKLLKKLKREDLSIAIDIMLERCSVDKYLENCSKRYKQAWQYYQNAQKALNHGDLNPASVWVQKAIILFAKERAYYEQGQSLILCGIICKISSLFDLAFFMYDDAKTIYNSLGLKSALADVYGHLGMLAISQQQFDNAEKYFEEAQKINKKIKRKKGIAEILNQMAILYLQQKKYTQASNFASQAQKKHQQDKNINGEAFALEIMAKINEAQKKYSLAQKNFQLSHKLYHKCNNHSGQQEALFGLAQILFSKQKMEDSENILRKILKIATENPGNFHVANVYNLLGLIYIHRKDWQRAKGLFEQSLNIELRDDRLKAIACDYANIALMEGKLGHTEEEKAQIKNAIEYAKTCGDEDTIKKISSLFNVNQVSTSTDSDC